MILSPITSITLLAARRKFTYHIDSILSVTATHKSPFYSMSKGIWTKQFTVEGKSYYFNAAQNRSLWAPPADSEVHDAAGLKIPTYLELSGASSSYGKYAEEVSEAVVVVVTAQQVRTPCLYFNELLPNLQHVIYSPIPINSRRRCLLSSSNKIISKSTAPLQRARKILFLAPRNRSILTIATLTAMTKAQGEKASGHSSSNSTRDNPINIIIIHQQNIQINRIIISTSSTNSTSSSSSSSSSSNLKILPHRSSCR